MARVLVLAESGFGKTTSLMHDEEYGIEGLNPNESYIITVTSKPLPGKGSRKLYPIVPNFTLNSKVNELKGYRRIISNDPATVAHAISLLGQSPFRNIVLDDVNYLMQDYYMAKSLSTGWDTPKRIGYDMGKIFDAIQKLPENKNFIMLAHGEEYDKADGRKGYRMKTVGRMVTEYITPEGKFDIVLIGKSSYDDTNKKVIKQFVTNDDGVFSSAKSHKIFPTTYINNDMGYVIRMSDLYYNEVDEVINEPVIVKSDGAN